MIKLNIIDENQNRISIGNIKKLSMLIQNKSSYDFNVNSLWNQYICGGGMEYFQIKCNGIIHDKKSSSLLLKYALENFIFKYEYILEDKIVMVAYAKIDVYEKIFYSSQSNEFYIVLLSSGKVEML